MFSTERERETYEVVPVEGFGSEGGERARSGVCRGLCAGDVGRNGKCERYEETDGRHGYKKGKNTGDLGGGKGQRLARWSIGTTYGFYEPAKIKQTGIAKRIHRGCKSQGIARMVIPSVAGRHPGLGSKRCSERGHRLQQTEGRRGDRLDPETLPDAPVASPSAVCQPGV